MNSHGTSTRAHLIPLTERLDEPGGSGGIRDAGLLKLGLARLQHPVASEAPEDACRAVRRA